MRIFEKSDILDSTTVSTNEKTILNPTPLNTPRHLSRILLWGMSFLWICGSPDLAGASLMQWPDLLYQMQEQVSWSGMRFETKVQVFDPLPPRKADGTVSAVSLPLPQRGYTQRIHWKDSSLLAVETFSASGSLVHHWWSYEGEQREWRGAPGFTQDEVQWLWLEFTSRRRLTREQALREWGVRSFRVSQELDGDNNVYYRVGHPTSGAHAWIDPQTFQLHALRQPILLPDGQEWMLEVIYLDFKTYRQQDYPSVAEYRLNGKLLKKMTITQLERIGDLPVGSLREQSLKLKAAEPPVRKVVDYAR